MQAKRLLRQTCFFAAATLMMASAHADYMSLPYGWYLEGYLGSTNLSGSTYPGSVSASGLGGGGDFGYKFNPFIAAEVGYTRYAGITIKNAAGTGIANGKIYSYDIAARGILPIYCTGAELFGKLGVGRISSGISITDPAGATALGLSASNHSATNWYAGVGAQYYLIPEFALVVQWARQQGNSSTGNLDLFSAGASFIIG